jgi:hypothetical protein
MANAVSPQTYHEGPRSWLADQLLEPTKLVFAVVIAESLREYQVVLTSPIHNGHYIAALALGGVYLTTVWSWFGWHSAHVKYPYKVTEGSISSVSEKLRFYADLAIVIAYAYALFQIEPLVADPRHNLMWLLVAYPIIIALYGAENILRNRAYGRDARRAIPLAPTFGVFSALTVVYIFVRREFDPVTKGNHDLLWLNGTTLVAYMVMMFCYRRFNDWYKTHIGG